MDAAERLRGYLVVGRSEALRLAVEGERQRCLALVSGYRITVEHKLKKRVIALTPEQAAITKRVLDALLQIESEIRHPRPQAEPSQVLPGDFSMEEMERAAAMIEEQERNPFEV